MTVNLRIKILLISLAIFSATLGATAWVSSVIFAREYAAALQARAFAIGHSLKLQLDRLIKLHIPLPDLIGFDEQCRETVAQYPGISFARVIDPAGRILFHNDPRRHDQIVSDPLLRKDVKSNRETIGFYEIDGHRVYGIVIPVFGEDDKLIAAVNIGFPEELIATKTRQMVGYTVATAVVFLGIGSMLLMVLLNLWVSRPLGKLLAAIRDIVRTGADSTQVVAVASRDEIGQLAAAFNGMIIELNQSHRKIREYAGDLEATNEKLRVDLEERLRLEQIEKQLQQAQKMESIGTLAGGIAHDFNNVLTIIIGNTDLALLNLDKGHRARRFLEEINAAGQRASGLTRQILAFSRKQIIQPQVVDLNDVISRTRKMMGRLIGENIELVLRTARELRKVKVDPSQMEQVIFNLAVNSRDAMPEGGRLIIETANVELDEAYGQSHADYLPGAYVLLAVTDTGLGMDKEVKSRIFEPFFTTKKIGMGTGMGLATVYGIVKQNKGYINVYSEPGVGTTFKIYLPCHEGETDTLPKEADALPESLKGWETILVVEDDLGLRKMTCQVLSQNGYDILEAQNGAEALAVSGRHAGPIHLVLTDVIMPGISVREMTAQIQSLRQEVKILYISGYTDEAIAHYGVLEKGIAFLSKPFSSSQILSQIRQVLDGKLP